ncbi:MAG: alkaline phosphatase [Phycisphaerales bacterium]|nr:alkaline phosphatase [Phycisphaerales bacterium]
MRAMWCAGVLAVSSLASGAGDPPDPQCGSVIFIHPDGASAATWAVARAMLVGPDGDLNWDRLPHIAVYRGHMADSLTATSNGGATTHAFGIKVGSDAFGRTDGGEDGREIVDGDGNSLSVAHQAMRAGIPVGLVQTGIASEPGTACFVSSVASRGEHDEICAQLVESGIPVLLSGGERYFLPSGVQGVHGAGTRKDSRDLVEEAKAAGYTVVYTRGQLLSLPADCRRVLGLFAWNHTFNDRPEEELAARGLPLYEPDAPTVGEMTKVAIRLLAAQGEQFFLVVEEEGTDNFGNNNNASGTIEAMRRADQAFGVASWYLQFRPDTLILTAADSDGGGMRMRGIPVSDSEPIPSALPPRAPNGAPIDGVEGTGGRPFMAAPDRNGRSLPFGVVWSTTEDVSGGVLVRAAGLNANLVKGSMDNTELAQLMRLTLFGRTIPVSGLVADDASRSSSPALR